MKNPVGKVVSLCTISENAIVFYANYRAAPHESKGYSADAFIPPHSGKHETYRVEILST